MVYEKLGEQVFGTTGKLVIFGATSLQNTGGKNETKCASLSRTVKWGNTIMFSNSGGWVSAWILT